MRKGGKEKVSEMEPLPDPRNNRQVKEIVPPAHRPLSSELLFNAGISLII